MFETNSSWKGTTKYQALIEQMQNGGAERFVYEAMNHVFRTQDNGRLVINTNLKTEAAVRQIAQSRSPLQKAIATLLLNGPAIDEEEQDLGLGWSMSKPWTVTSRRLEELVQALVQETDYGAVKRVTLHTIINELHRHIGETKEDRPKGPVDPRTGKRRQLPTQRVLPPRREALGHARGKGLITQEEYEMATGGKETT